MAKEKENVVEETTKQSVEKKEKQPRDKKGKFKSKNFDDNITKVDLSNPKTQEDEDVKQESTEEDVVVVNEEPKTEESKNEEPVKEEQEDSPVVQDVTDEKVEEEEIVEQVQEAVAEAEATGNPLPENIQKLMNFMNETGGDLNDYVNLNRDTSKMDDSEVLDEYYRTTKSHLSPEERNFLLEDTFGYDEEEDDAKTIRKKKIALKEQVAEARAHLDRQKSKYYEEIKAGSKLTPEQQKAINDFNKLTKETEAQRKKSEAGNKIFLQKTEKIFNDKFKGFDYEIGDKKFRFNVKDVNKVKETQSDINNFLGRFVGDDNVTIKDAAGYHKSLFTAMNADVVAKHFYEQGRADAIKGQVAKDKNINTQSRQTHSEVDSSGFKYRPLGVSSSDIKNRSFKIRKKN